MWRHPKVEVSFSLFVDGKLVHCEYPNHFTYSYGDYTFTFDAEALIVRRTPVPT
jgi:hypothetical protein